MKRSTTRWLTLATNIALQALLACTPAHAQGASDDTDAADDADRANGAVLARVGDRDIVVLSVEDVARQLEADGEPADRARILDELIDMEVLTQAAEARGLDERPDIATALRLQYVQTLANAFLADEGERLVIDEDDLREEYARRTGALSKQELRGRHILLDTEEEARDAIARLAAGADFEALANDISTDAGVGGSGGGDLGWFRPDAMIDEVGTAFAALEAGGTSAVPVKSTFGYHVLRLDERRTASLPDFESLEPALTDLVMRRRLAERVAQLREAANVERPGQGED